MNYIIMTQKLMYCMCQKQVKKYRNDKVDEDNIEMIKSFYNDFRNVMGNQEKLYMLDLDENDIDYDDYYGLNGVNKSCAHYPNFNLQLYDTDNHILYLLYVG